MESQGTKVKMVYTVIDRDKQKAIWLKIGVGTVNRDGSLNLKLDALPVNGQLHVRDHVPMEAAERPDLGRPPPRLPPTGPRERDAANVEALF